LRARVKELLEQGDRRFSNRFPLLTLWQSMAENFHPMRADFTRNRYPSEEFASYLMSGMPVMAHRDLTGALSFMLRPQETPWFEALTDNEEINQDPQAKGWLERTDLILRRILYDRRSQFVRATKEGDGDFVAFGQCVIEVTQRQALDGLLFRTWHLRDCVWTENAEGIIDSLQRKWKLEARQVIRIWPDKVSSELETRAEKEPSYEVNLRVITVPIEEAELPNKPKSKALAFARIIVDEDHQTVLEEVPQRRFGYVVPRWVTIGAGAGIVGQVSSVYAYSPAAVVALPDARMLQQIGLTLLEAGQKVVDPPMIAVGEAINGGVNLYAGGVTHVDVDYDERTGEVLRPITLRPEGLQWGDEREKLIESKIKEAFYLNTISLPALDMSGEKMTAEEVRERIKEYVRRAAPLFEPMVTEYNGQLVEETFELAMSMGAFGSPYDMPQVLRGQNVRFRFQNPLLQAEDEAKTVSFTKASQLLAAAMQIDPSVQADFDTETAYRDAYAGTGGPAKWLRSQQDAARIKQQMAQQQQAAQQAAMLGHVGEQAGKLGTAVKNVGDAAQSLQGAGIV
jgi:Bacteriophage head to tail connecting protein